MGDGDEHRFVRSAPGNIRGRGDGYAALMGWDHHPPGSDSDVRDRRAQTLQGGIPSNRLRASALPLAGGRGEYLRWGDWAKSGMRSGEVGGRLDPASYQHDPVADQARLKVAKFRLDPLGKIHHHDGFLRHDHPGAWSLTTRQSLNFNKMNYLGTGVFSVPRK